MTLSIQFVKGSLAGRRFPVGPAGVSVGRSHSCDARPKEADVSGKHVSVMPAGDALAVTVLSAHRTVADGVRQSQGSVFAAQAGTTVCLGDHLEFRVVDDSAADDGETGAIPGQFTATLGSETGTSPASLTAATRFGGDETGTSPASLTAATRFGGGRGETSIFHAPASPDSGVETGTEAPGDGETQVLQTQAVSAEELAAMRETFRKKRSGKTVSRVVAFAIAIGAFAGFAAWMSSKKPELVIVEKRPWETRAVMTGGTVPGSFGISWPTNSGPAEAHETENGRRIDAETRIGRDGDVTLWVTAIAFDDPESLSETRDETFLRHLQKSEEMAAAVEGMIPLPEEDFFGGAGGLHHGVPCSRREYWRSRKEDGKQVWGVVSFFRFGTTCCEVRREVEKTERERVKAMLEPSAMFIWADDDGKFADSQWEGAAGAGCNDPGKELRNCSKRLAAESRTEWPALEMRLRNVLVATSKPGAGAEEKRIRGEAMTELVKLRDRKSLAWRGYMARRQSLAAITGREGDKERKEIDALVRKVFPDASEQWGALARRRVWWR
ncbi:MAG: hypothetical protein IJ678_00330 [Kiritimatiellae bacterium]|nr:hypothetical protein [Kiritimatiellia bacterium]